MPSANIQSIGKYLDKKELLKKLEEKYGKNFDFELSVSRTSRCLSHHSALADRRRLGETAQVGNIPKAPKS